MDRDWQSFFNTALVGTAGLSGHDEAGIVARAAKIADEAVLELERRTAPAPSKAKAAKAEKSAD